MNIQQILCVCLCLICYFFVNSKATEECRVKEDFRKRTSKLGFNGALFICETLSRALLKKLFGKSFLRIFKNFEANFGVSYMLMYLSTTARSRSSRDYKALNTSVAHSPESKEINRRDLLVAAAVAARVLPFGHTHDAT